MLLTIQSESLPCLNRGDKIIGEPSLRVSHCRQSELAFLLSSTFSCRCTAPRAGKCQEDAVLPRTDTCTSTVPDTVLFGLFHPADLAVSLHSIQWARITPGQSFPASTGDNGSFLSVACVFRPLLKS